MLPHANTFWGMSTPTRAHSGSNDRWLNKKHLVLISGLSRAIRNRGRKEATGGMDKKASEINKAKFVCYLW